MGLFPGELACLAVSGIVPGGARGNEPGATADQTTEKILQRLHVSLPSRHQLSGLWTTDRADLALLDRADLKGAKPGEGDRMAVLQRVDDAFEHSVERLVPIGMRALQLGRHPGRDVALTQCLCHRYHLPA